MSDRYVYVEALAKLHDIQARHKECGDKLKVLERILLHRAGVASMKEALEEYEKRREPGRNET